MVDIEYECDEVSVGAPAVRRLEVSELSITPLLNEADQAGSDVVSDVSRQDRILIVLLRAPKTPIEVDCLGHGYQVVGDIKIKGFAIIEVAAQREIE